MGCGKKISLGVTFGAMLTFLILGIYFGGLTSPDLSLCQWIAGGQIATGLAGVAVGGIVICKTKDNPDEALDNYGGRMALALGILLIMLGTYTAFGGNGLLVASIIGASTLVLSFPIFGAFYYFRDIPTLPSGSAGELNSPAGSQLGKGASPKDVVTGNNTPQGTAAAGAGDTNGIVNGQAAGPKTPGPPTTATEPGSSNANHTNDGTMIYSRRLLPSGRRYSVSQPILDLMELCREAMKKDRDVSMTM